MPSGAPPPGSRQAEPVFEALRLRLGLQILPGSLSLLPAPSVLANATSKDSKKGFNMLNPYRLGNHIGLPLHNLSCVFYLKRGRCGRGRAFATGKHRLPLPLEGVCRKRGFARLRPGGTALAVPPPRAFDLSSVPRLSSHCFSIPITSPMFR